MSKFYFTFMQKSTLAHSYVVIEAPTPTEARRIMHEHYGFQWAFHYTQEGFHGQPERYNLTEVPLGTEQQIYEEHN